MSKNKVCCDTFPGYLTLLHDRDDQAALSLIEQIRMGNYPGIIYDTDMASTLSRRHASTPTEFRFRMHRLKVLEGEEAGSVNQLWSAYNNRLFEDLAHHKVSFGDVSQWTHPDKGLLIAPDFALSHDAPGQPAFQMNRNTQGQYDQILGLPYGLGSGRGVVVAVIDSGLDPSSGVVMDARSQSFHDDNAIQDVTDNYGHGTAVANVIRHVAPHADILVLKVGDQGPIAEWNVLAALLAALDCQAQVVNMSIGFSLGIPYCPSCGRNQTESSRSAIFERVIREVLRIQPDTILVAAAGNRKTPMLDYPSRFAEIVAVGAIDRQRSLSTFGPQSGSNWGTSAIPANQLRGPVANRQQSHDLLFFAPGGGIGEYVASTNINGQAANWHGTSFAAPFASGLFALYLSDPGVSHDRASVLHHFHDQASRNGSVRGLKKTEFGNGIISIS